MHKAGGSPFGDKRVGCEVCAGMVREEVAVTRSLEGPVGMTLDLTGHPRCLHMCAQVYITAMARSTEQLIEQLEPMSVVTNRPPEEE